MVTGLLIWKKLALLLLLVLIFIFTLPLGLLFCPKSLGNSEDTAIMNSLWIIGEKDLSTKEFNRCLGVRVTEYTIVGQGQQESPGFPCGLARENEENKDNNCLPSEIYLRFSLMQSYSRLSLALQLLGSGGFTISFDSNPPQEVDLDTGLSWEEKEFGQPFILKGEHTITLKATRNYILFDYLEFTGYADTDQDGVADQDEGMQDSDQDGVTDDQDPDCTMLPLSYSQEEQTYSQEEKMLLMVRSMDYQDFSQNITLREVHLLESQSIQDPNLPVKSFPDIMFKYGLIIARIDGLNPGQRVRVILSPPSLYGLEEIQAKNKDGVWLSLNTAIDTGSNQIQAAFRDGKLEDMDGVANGRISLCLGLSVPTTLAPYSIDSCFLGLISGLFYHPKT